MGAVLGTPVAADSGSTYTAETGSNRVLVYVGASTSDGAKTISAITFGGVSMTQAAFLSSDIAGYECNSGLWYIKEASIPAGSQALSITWSGTILNGSGLLMTLGGIDQSSTIVGTASGDYESGVQLSSGVTVVAGDVGIVGICANSQYITIGTPSGSRGTYTAYAQQSESNCSTLAASCVYSSSGSEQPTATLNDVKVSSAVLVVFKEATGDTTAPVLTAPVATATAATTATVGATTDEANGTLYSVITTSSTQPSVAQIKAGQNHLGASATWSSNQAISSTGAKTFSVTGLTAGTMYYTYTVHADAAGNNSNVVASGFAAYSVSAASATPVTQSVALNATGSFAYTLNVTPVSVTPVANVVALTLATPISTAAVTPVTQNIVLAVTLPVTRAQALPLTQSVALNFSGVVAYTLNVTPAYPTIAMQDVALNPSYPSAGGVGATTGRRNRRYSYALKYFSRG